MRQGFCGAITDSRGHACAYERASHLTRDTLNGTAADATFSSDLQHTLAGPQLILDSLFQGWVCRSRFLCRPRKPGSPPCELP